MSEQTNKWWLDLQPGDEVLKDGIKRTVTRRMSNGDVRIQWYVEGDKRAHFTFVEPGDIAFWEKASPIPQ